MYIPETIAAIILICLVVQWIRDRVNARVQRGQPSKPLSNKVAESITEYGSFEIYDDGFKSNYAQERGEARDEV